jgi:hypothetical protein
LVVFSLRNGVVQEAVECYVLEANQKKRAKAAIRRQEEHDANRTFPNRPKKFGNNYKFRRNFNGL